MTGGEIAAFFAKRTQLGAESRCNRQDWIATRAWPSVLGSEIERTHENYRQ